MIERRRKVIITCRSTNKSSHFLVIVNVLLFSSVCTTIAQIAQEYYEGDSCRFSSQNLIGVCTSARDCPEAFANNVRPDLCSYSGTEAIICCPGRVTSNGGFQSSGGVQSPRPSQIKCEEYSKLSVNKFSVSPLVDDPEVFDFEVPICNFNTPLIVDGEKTTPGEFPHMAAVGWQKEDGKIEWNCGGVLISDEFVMTAAHCGGLFGDPPTLVRLGDQNLVESNDNAQPHDYTIRQIIIHPEYKRPMVYNDIALLRLSKVGFNKFIRPACLWQQHGINVTQAVASGWGLIDFASERSDELLKVLLNIYPQSECDPFFERNRKVPRGIIDSQLCAGNRGGRQDTCQGDSGGPLQIVNAGSCTFNIIGLTSFGKSCGLSNSPGVYTRVSSYLDWIEKQVWPNL